MVGDIFGDSATCLKSRLHFGDRATCLKSRPHFGDRARRFCETYLGRPHFGDRATCWRAGAHFGDLAKCKDFWLKKNLKSRSQLANVPLEIYLEEHLVKIELREVCSQRWEGNLTIFGTVAYWRPC